MIDKIVRYLIYQPIMRFRGEHPRREFKAIPGNFEFDGDAINKYQKEKISELILKLYHVSPYYHQILSSLNFDEKDENKYWYLKSLPIMTKDLIREQKFESFGDKSKYRISYRGTSGTTGKPFVFPKDRSATGFMEELTWHVYGWYNISIGDKQARFWGTPVDASEKFFQSIKDHLLRRRRFSAFKTGDDNFKKFWKLLQIFKPKYFYGYPNVIAAFAEYLYKERISGAQLGLSAIICTGEILYEWQRKIITEVFSCRVVNEYGTTENGLIAFECSHGRLHILSHNIFLECLDDQGEALPEGEIGQLVITELNSTFLPFVRYSVGDRGRIVENECGCGRKLPQLDLRLGRVDSFILTPKGERIYDAVLAYTFKTYFSQFRCIQYSLNELVIYYVPSRFLEVKDFENIERKLRKYIGDEILLNFKKVDNIFPEASGKLRYFVSMVDDA